MLNDYLAILRVTTIQRDARALRMLAFIGVPVTLVVAVIVGVLAWKHESTLAQSLRALTGIAGLWLTLAWMFLFVPGSLMLNSAANARLLPRQRRRLIQMTAASWLLLSGACTAVLGNWAVFPLAGIFLLGGALTFSGNLGAIALMVLPTNWPFVSRFLLPSWLRDAVTSTAGLWTATALLLLCGARALRWMYPAGGDAHLGKRARQVERLQRMQQGETWTQSVESGTVTGSSALRFYAGALRRDCRAPQAGAMLMHALGPGAHWSIWIFSLAVMLVVGVVIRLILAGHDSSSVRDFVEGVSMSGLGGMVSMILFSTAQLGQSIGKTRGEQALLRLTPLAGDQRLLNRRLARQLLLRGMGTWLMLTAAILLLALLIGGTGVLAREAALCCLAGQVSMMGLLGDYARDGGWRLSLALWAGLLAALEAGAAVGVAWLTQTSPWGWMAAIAIAATVFQLQRARRRMLAAAPAFPARRLALS